MNDRDWYSLWAFAIISVIGITIEVSMGYTVGLILAVIGAFFFGYLFHKAEVDEKMNVRKRR